MTLSAIYTLVSKIGIPKRKEGPKVYYSKYHLDVAKGAKSAEDVEFISVAEAMEKYGYRFIPRGHRIRRRILLHGIRESEISES